MAVKLKFWDHTVHQEGNGSIYREGRDDARRIKRGVMHPARTIRGVDRAVVQFVEDMQWWIIAQDADDDLTFEPQGPFPNPESALVALRLQADTKDEE